MARHKIRLEAEVEIGDLVRTADAMADALESAAKDLRASQLLRATDVLDVPRGKLAYAISKES